jgi:hypothetical protein
LSTVTITNTDVSNLSLTHIPTNATPTNHTHYVNKMTFDKQGVSGRNDCRRDDMPPTKGALLYFPFKISPWKQQTAKRFKTFISKSILIFQYCSNVIGLSFYCGFSSFSTVSHLCLCHRYLRKVDCSRQTSLKKNLLGQECK